MYVIHHTTLLTSYYATGVATSDTEGPVSYYATSVAPIDVDAPTSYYALTLLNNRADVNDGVYGGVSKPP